MLQIEILDKRVLLKRDMEERRPLVQRLNRIEGQLRGIRTMIEEDRHCADEIVQIKAVLAATREVAMLITQQHVEAVSPLIGGEHSELATADMMRVLREAARV